MGKEEGGGCVQSTTWQAAEVGEGEGIEVLPSTVQEEFVGREVVGRVRVRAGV